MLKVDRETPGRICQGDILHAVRYFESLEIQGGDITINLIEFPLAVVLTQDCDLAQDEKFRASADTPQDKLLISVLLAPAYNSEDVLAGKHLEKLGIRSQPINTSRTEKTILKNNKNPRYHYLEFPDEVAIPPAIVDFKHYFSATVSYVRDLKVRNFVCKIGELYREDLSQRFSSFLSRVGLPEQGG